MVLSKIAEDINYTETSKLRLSDKDHSSCLYIIPLYENDYLVALGKQNSEYANKEIVYYNIYLLNQKHKIKSRIGVYEASTSIATSLLDDDGDVDLTQLEDPLLFSFVTPDYLDTYGTHGEDLSAKTMTPEDIKKQIEDEVFGTADDEHDDIKEVEIGPDESDLDQDTEDEDSDDDVFNIQKPAPKETSVEKEDENTNEDTSVKRLTFDDVFEKEEPLPILPTWVAETADDAKTLRENYKKSKNTQDTWLVTAMKNKEYKLHRNEGGGDCMFAAIRDSYAQLGYKTTIQKLRQYLSQQVDITLYEQYKDIYDGIEIESKALDREMNDLQKTNVALKKQSDKTDTVEHQKDIVNEALYVKKQYNKKKTQKGGVGDLIEEFGFMKNIHNLDDLKTFVQTSEYWGDHWAFIKMEAFLKTKFLVLENTDDANQMIRCTDNHEDEFDPTYYILFGYYGDRHYELASYKDKKIFKFGEIPFDVKKLVVDKCMEKSTGVYNRIGAFRQFQTEMGIKPTDPRSSSQPDDEREVADLYDPKLVLSFHARSDQKKKPGLVEADEIPIPKRTLFSELTKPEFSLWRRRLDDSWVGDGKTAAPFTTADGKRWASIEHYLMALPFKESNPAVYVDFSTESAIGKSLEKAKEAIGKKKGKEGKHYEVFKKTSQLDDSVRDAYRKEALMAKFSQNLDLKEILKATGMAKLERHRQGQAPFVDIALMEVRKGGT